MSGLARWGLGTFWGHCGMGVRVLARRPETQACELDPSTGDCDSGLPVNFFYAAPAYLLYGYLIGVGLAYLGAVAGIGPPPPPGPGGH
jgi:hypothetical protein